MTDPTTSRPAGESAAPTLAIVRDYGDPAAEYAALRAGALRADRSRRDRWVLRGARARETLTGLVTNDVMALAAGQGCYAAALTAKGRIVADVRILALAGGPAIDGAEGEAASAGAALAEPPAAVGDVPGLHDAVLLVDVPPRAADGFAALLRKFVNPRVTPYARLGDDAMRALGVYGVRARDAISAVFGAPPAALAALSPYAHATVTIDGHTLLLVRAAELGLDGFELMGAPAAVDAAWTRLARAVPGVVPAGDDALTIARIEAGYPEWGVDMDDTTIPQEANFDELHAISYTKGCYTGQEVVARVHFRGHVNRHLRGLGYLADGGAIPRGAELLDETGKVVGDVRSSAVSPRLGGIAIAMVRREIALGATLTARWRSGADATPAADDLEAVAPTERGVTVTTLPFPL